MPDRDDRSDAGERLAKERNLQRQLARAQEVAKLGSWEVDLDRGLLTWSDMVFRIFEIGREDFAGTEEAFFSFVHPDDRPAFLDARAEWLKNGGTFFLEHRIVTPSGKIIWVAERAEIINGDDGAPKFTIGTVQDITDFKTAELAREGTERRHTELARIAGEIGRIGGWRYIVAANRLEWSDETARIHGEPVGTQPTVDGGIGYYVPEDRPRIQNLFRQCLENGIGFDDSFRLITTAGREITVRSVGTAERDASGRIVAVQGAFQDISELVDAHDTATKLSERLHAIMEGMSDAFYLLSSDWRFTFVNSMAEKLLKRSREDLLGRVAWGEFPEAAGKIKTEYERALSEMRQVRFEDYYPPMKTWFEISADPTPFGLAVYFRDITDQRGRDNQLRLLEAAVGRQNDILLITEAEPINGPDGPRIMYVNEAFERRTGFSREEAIGKTPRILQGPKTQRDELDRIRFALEKWQPVRAELINYTKSGQEFWLELDIVPLANERGCFTHWVSIERDITARKQAEEALKSNEERFRLVTKAAGSAIWDWDVTSNRQWWSEGLREIFGHDVDPTGSLPTVWHMHVHPHDAARIEAAFGRVESGQANSLCEQYRFRRANGSWAYVEDKAFALHDADGKLLRILGSMTDISEQKHLEDRLRQAQKMETVGQLTGGVAHDFNNLLTILLGNAELLEEALTHQPHLQKLARVSLDAADRGAELTSRLLAFSRKQALEPRVVDVAKLVQGMDGLFRRTLPENIDIEVVRCGGLWKIEADPPQLEATLLNLVVNARDAMPDGGCLTIEIANAMLDDDYVATEPDVMQGQYVVIVVTDTGHGISPEHLGRVFEPFFTTKGVGKGSGLGLSMVFGFVKQSGGHIRVYSEPGEGTSVKLYFPRAKADPEHVVAERIGRKIIGGTETVLVVEDDDAVRQHVTAQLRGLGYNVLEASRGVEAMEVIRNPGTIDLLFTDVVMSGGMSGGELALAARGPRPNLKVLFTSGYTENSIVHHGRLDRGVKLLSKPYRRDQLAMKVREVLEDND